MATDRRTFLRRGGGCLAQLALLDATGWLGPDLFAQTRPARLAREEPWGRLEEVADGVWALVSTPLQDGLTLCNGGIVRGRDGVAIVEAFASDGGAVWMAEQARELTGRWPDQVVVTHYHSDHVGGLPGFASAGDGTGSMVSESRMTAVTRDLTLEWAVVAEAAELLAALERVTVVPGDAETRLDLGGRVLRIVPRSGHTASDVTVELDDPSVVFCGDLVWHRFFPNFVDARPAELGASVRALTRHRDTIYVPGHGPLADSGELELFRRFLDEVEAHARAAHRTGAGAEEAAASLQLSAPFADWYRFSSGYPYRAMRAWYEELGSGFGSDGA